MARIANSLVCFAFSVAIVAQAGAHEALDEVIARFEKIGVESDPDSADAGEGPLPVGWDDISPEAEAKTLTELKAIRTDLSNIETGELTEDEDLNRAILETILNDRITLAGFDEVRMPFTGDWGFHAYINFTISRLTLRSETDAVNTVARINAIPDYLAAHKANMQRGLETGFVSYADPLNTVLEQLAEMHVQRPEDSALYTPFREMPVTLPEGLSAGLQTDAKQAVTRALSAFADIETFLRDEYAPKAREKAGIADQPDAKAYYTALVAFHTTLPDLTPEEVHEIGQSEVARIRAEMNAIIEEADFEGGFEAFLNFLRTDPQFYAETSEELMAAAARLAKDIDFQMPEFFGHLPRRPYGVEPVPAEIAPGYTTGRYVSGSLKSGQAGAYWVNTYALDQRPLYELPSLTAHEAVPGHHHQISIAQELEDVPEFRKQYYATSFGEGWGLYAESLASEMGLYNTPYKRFGKLSYEMWRACRLVADTGMHWYGWSREEAEKCFVENSALAPLNIKTEVTRYIGWPGQALGYKIGELKIKELRTRAEQALGKDFDLREFHDKVLEKGSLPLVILEQRIDGWIAEKQA